MMISSVAPLFQIIILSLTVIGIAVLLKWKGIFKDEDQPVFDKLVTELAVPSIIFFFLITTDFTVDTIFPAVILFFGLVISLCVAYAICRMLRFSPKVTGTLVMVSGFGSTATLGSPLLVKLFQFQSGVMQQGVGIGTIGVAFPFFTLGALIASHFGSIEKGDDVSYIQTLRKFLMTPIFLSFLLGGVVAVILNVNHITGASIYLDFFTHFFTIISDSTVLLLWIAIGIMIRPAKLTTVLSLLFMVVLIKMIFEPLVTVFMGDIAGFSTITNGLLLIESAMPAGALASVLASRYGCDSSLAGWMVVGTYIVSLVTIPFLFLIAPV